MRAMPVTAPHEKRLLLPVPSHNGSANSNLRTVDTDSDSCCDDNNSDDDDVRYVERGREKLACPLLNKTGGICKFKMLGLLRPRRRCRFRSTLRTAGCVLIAPMLLFMLYMPLYPNMQTRQTTLLDWSYNTSRNIPDYVLPENETTILAPHDVCHDKMFLIVIVCSSMQNFATRQIIRETWGNTTQFNYNMFTQLHSQMRGQYLKPTQERIQFYSEYLNMPENATTLPATLPVRVYFLLGRSRADMPQANETHARIRSEAMQYNDIIQEDFIDTYNNLTIKSVLALKFLTRRCMQRVAFIMKCDDDTFLNMPNLLHYLLGGTIPLYNDTVNLYNVLTFHVLSAKNRLNSTANFLGGHQFCKVRPVAKISSKWYMPYHMFPGDVYPNYLSGAAYVMSADVVPRLYEAALNTSLMYIEDVFLTGICAEKVHLRRRHNALFSYTHSSDWCAYRGSIMQHELKEGMLEAYNFVINASMYCAPPPRYLMIRLSRPGKCS